jgi:quinoprotein glucose dehydrogenase
MRFSSTFTKCGRIRAQMTQAKTLTLFTFVVLSLCLGVFVTAQSSRQVEWLYYGSDQAGTRYSQLADINSTNVQQLHTAWQWKHWETPLKEYETTPGFFEATPLMIDGVLYVTTPYNSIAALDAETGKELWRFDGEAYKLGQVLSGSGWKLRGTGFWRDNGRLFIFLNSRNRLLKLDARTGEPVHTFGNNGEASLTDLPRISDMTHATQSSPPVIYKDLVILGSQVPDRVQVADPVGYVQAINARTGRRVWTFSVIPQSAKDPGADKWPRQRLGANGSRRGARSALSSDIDAEQRLLRRPTAGRRSVCRVVGMSGRSDRKSEVVLSDRASRVMGLGPSDAA